MRGKPSPPEQNGAAAQIFLVGKEDHADRRQTEKQAQLVGKFVAVSLFQCVEKIP